MDESSDEFPATVAEPISSPSLGLGESNGDRAQAGSRADLERRLVADEVRELIRENSALRAENTTLQQLCRDYLSAKQQLDRLSAFLEDMFGRGVWDFIRKVKRARAAEAGRDDHGAILASRHAPPQAVDPADREDGRAGPGRWPNRQEMVVPPEPSRISTRSGLARSSTRRGTISDEVPRLALAAKR